MNFTAPKLNKVDSFTILEPIANAVFFIVDTIERIQLQIVRAADIIYAEVVDKIIKHLNVEALTRTYAFMGGNTSY